VLTDGSIDVSAKIAAELGVSVGTISEAKKQSASLLDCPKIRERDF
jgi:hypothetical protein